MTGILERIEKELDSVESKIGEAMHVLDTDNDGMVRACAVFNLLTALKCHACLWTQYERQCRTQQMGACAVRTSKSLAAPLRSVQHAACLVP